MSKTVLSYNPSTRTWVPVTSSSVSESVKSSGTTSKSTSSSSSKGSSSSSGGSSSSSKKESTSKTSSSSGGGGFGQKIITQSIKSVGKQSSSSSTASNETSGEDDANKAAKDSVLTSLVGDIQVTPTEETIKLRQSDTIYLAGVGKYLSGTYYITDVKHTIDNNNGYAVTLSVLKVGFGDKLKGGAESDTRKTAIGHAVSVSSKISVGDSVQIQGDNAIYTNASQGVRVPDWVKKKTLTVLAISDDGQRARLSPINSWTYISYLRKV